MGLTFYINISFSEAFKQQKNIRRMKKYFKYLFTNSKNLTIAFSLENKNNNEYFHTCFLTRLASTNWQKGKEKHNKIPVQLKKVLTD
jgi:hypothetical protein